MLTEDIFGAYQRPRAQPTSPDARVGGYRVTICHQLRKLPCNRFMLTISADPQLSSLISSLAAKNGQISAKKYRKISHNKILYEVNVNLSCFVYVLRGHLYAKRGHEVSSFGVM